MIECPMKSIACVVLLAGLCCSPLHASEDWKVHYGWTSGRGSDDGILISSDGRVGPVTDQLYDEFDECREQRVDPELIASIQRLIDEIPGSIPKNSHTRILDSCHDEAEHLAIISYGDKRQVFQYSKSESCLAEGDPPIWLEEIVTYLESFYSRLKNCNEDD